MGGRAMGGACRANAAVGGRHTPSWRERSSRVRRKHETNTRRAAHTNTVMRLKCLHHSVALQHKAQESCNPHAGRLRISAAEERYRGTPPEAAARPRPQMLH